MYAAVIVVIIVIAIVVVIVFYAASLDAYTIIAWWNRQIEPIRNRQNREVIELSRGMRVMIPSKGTPEMGRCPPGLIFAEDAPHPAVRKLHDLVRGHHQKIEDEVVALVARGYEGVPMIELDSVQLGLNEPRWRPIWVRFLGSWAGTADALPTLKRIVMEMGPAVSLLHVSVFGPGTQLPLHRGISMGVLRYQYALRIPHGDTGMLIGGTPFMWEQGRGYCFDDTYSHAAWNRTASPRWVVFADVPRELGFPYSQINHLMHRFIEKTKHIRSTTERLAKEGVRAD